MAYRELDKLLENHKIELSRNEAGTFGYEFQEAFDSKLKNPRLVKRYINRLTFLFPILQNEVSPTDLMLIEAIHVFYPNLYEIIRGNPKLLLGEGFSWELDLDIGGFEEKKRNELLKEEINSFPIKEQENIKRIITKLFPRTSSVFGNTYYGRGWNSNWTKEKKIASPDYFLRYFNYGIPINDIGDFELREFLSNLDSRTKDENSNGIKKLIANDRENIFLRKLRLIVDSLDEDIAISLARTISVNGDIFARKNLDESMFGREPFSQACILIRDCLKQIKEIKNRDNIAFELIKTATPLDFTGEYFRWNHSFKDDNGNLKEEFVSEKCENKMLSHLVSRIKGEAKQEPLEKRYPQKSSQLYYDWFYKDLKGLKNYLKRRFQKNPKEAENFIYSFGQQSYGVESIVKGYGFDFIISAIEKSNPQLVKAEIDEFLDYDEIQGKEKFLRYFLEIYRTNKENEQN